MYKQKYYEYSGQNIKRGGFTDISGFTNASSFVVRSSYSDNDPDFINPLDLDQHEPLTLEEEDAYNSILSDEEIDRNLESMIIERKNFKGFEIGSNTGTEFLTENLNQSVQDIGLYGKARGKIYEYTDFDKEDYIKMYKPSNKSKILMINNINSFDDFTIKYGEINENDNNIYIKWDDVSNKYKGIYIPSSALGNREDVIPYKDTSVNNWIYNDFVFLDKVVIFKKPRVLLEYREINNPFDGYVVDEYAIDEEDFIRIYDKDKFMNIDKILLIDDVKSFDIFTNKYGIPDKSNRTITIDWNKVSIDYDGIYIDKDNDFSQSRTRKVFYNDTKYRSWLKSSGIKIGLVYLFN